MERRAAELGFEASFVVSFTVQHYQTR